MLHRASMKYYADHLMKRGYDVEYYEWQKGKNLAVVFEDFKLRGVQAIHYSDTTDFLLEKRLSRCCNRCNIRAIRYQSPGFIFSTVFLEDYFDRSGKYFQTDFYIHARKSLNLLMKNGKPIGDRWTYDTENRKPLPAGFQIIPVLKAQTNAFIEEAADYVQKNFTQNPGTTDDFGYPVTFSDATQCLEDFLNNRLKYFGPYQDAIHPQHTFLFHSVLSPALNTGMLQPDYILEKTSEHAQSGNIPLNSLEGFIRQLIGWREFIRAVYQREGVRQRTTNFFGHRQPLPKSFYTGTTGIKPVDCAIHRVVHSAYTHHIERLMVLGNFMLLCQIHPDQVYRWFMELFIDAYDWVMVPNVYGMSQYADGGLMSTKPYISSSNYILKMSPYPKEAWAEIWDGLYWRFLEINKEKFTANPRMRLMLQLCQRMPAHRKTKLYKQAEQFLEKLYE